MTINTEKKQKSWTGPVFLIMLLAVGILSVLPTKTVSGLTSRFDFEVDYYLHMVSYAAFGFLLCINIRHKRVGMMLSFLLATFTVALLGFVIELIQGSMVGGRSMSLRDMQANAIGAVAGSLIAALGLYIRPFRFLKLPRERRILLLQAFCMLILVKTLLMIRKGENVRQWLLKQFPAQAAKGAAERDITWAVRSASRRLPGMSCLPQALVCQAMLNQQGWPSELKIGVNLVNSELEAHAWIESEGRVLLGDNGLLDSYKQLPLAEHKG